MIEMDPNQDAMDRLLQRSLAAPAPSLPPDFEQRLTRELRRRSQPLDRSGRLLLAGYGLLSAAVCAVLMRAQGMHWLPIALLTLSPLTATVPLFRARRAT